MHRRSMQRHQPPAPWRVDCPTRQCRHFCVFASIKSRFPLFVAPNQILSTSHGKTLAPNATCESAIFACKKRGSFLRVGPNWLHVLPAARNSTRKSAIFACKKRGSFLRVGPNWLHALPAARNSTCASVIPAYQLPEIAQADTPCSHVKNSRVFFSTCCHRK